MDLGLDELEQSLNLPEGFFDSIYDEDDWSFVIKLHAFLEAHFSMVIAKATVESLLDSITHIPIGATKYGKAKIALELRLISKEMLAFLRALSELRNILAHDIRNVSIDLCQHYTNQNKDKRNALYKQIGFAVRNTGSDEKTNRIAFDFNIKKAMHLGGLAIAYQLHLNTKELEVEKTRIESAMWLLKTEELEDP